MVTTSTFWSAAAIALCLAAGPTAAQAAGNAQGATSIDIGVKVGTLEVRDLAFDLPGQGHWSIGRIAFSGFVRDSARVRAERIDVEKIVIALGPQTMEIPSIVMTGADLPEPLFRALTAGEPAGDVAALLASAAVDRITVNRMVQHDPSVQVEATYRDLSIANFKNGIFESVRIGGSEATASPPGAPGKVHLRVGEVRYRQFDFAETLRMLTGGGTGGAKRILQSAAIDGIDVTTDRATFHIKRAEIADVEGRAPAQPLPPQLRLQTAAGTHALSPEQAKLAAGFMRDFVRFARVGRYSIEGISGSVPHQGSFSIDSIAVAGLSARGIDRFAIAGFDLRVPEAPFHVDRFEFERLDYGGLIDAALNAAASGTKPDFSPEQIGQMMPRLSGIRLSHMRAETPQGPVALGDAHFARQDRGDETGFESAIGDLAIDLSRLDRSDGRNKLMALGYRRLSASANAHIDWLRKEHALVVRIAGLSLDQVGRIEIKARLDNVDVDKALADPSAADRLMREARLGPIEIRLTDLGLAERFYADAAKRAGVSPAAIRAGLAAELRTRATANFGPLLAGHSTDAIQKFLQSPGVLTARITPAAGQQPLSIAEIQALPPTIVMQRLSVTLEAGAK